MAPRKAKGKNFRESSLASFASDISVKEETMSGNFLNKSQEDFKREMQKYAKKLEHCQREQYRRLELLHNSVPSVCDKYLEELDLSTTISELIDGMSSEVIKLYECEFKQMQTEVDDLCAEVRVEVEDYCNADDVNKTVANLLRDFSQKVPTKMRQLLRQRESAMGEFQNAIRCLKRKHTASILRMTYGDFLTSQEDKDVKPVIPTVVVEPPASKRARENQVEPPQTTGRSRPTRRVAANMRTPSLDSSVSTASRTVSSRSASVQGRVGETPAVIPKFDVNLSSTALPKRLPRPGEVVMSLSGSPLLNAEEIIQMTTGVRGAKSRCVRDRLELQSYMQQMRALLGDSSILLEGNTTRGATASRGRPTSKKK